MTRDVPDTHPRAHSLNVRERLAEGLSSGVVTLTGMIAHGRGEAFDYLLGEKTHPFAHEALDVASAMLTLAEHPVISINGNVAALAFEEMITLQHNHPRLVFEVNLFHYSPERARTVVDFLLDKGLKNVLDSSAGEPQILAGLESSRRWMHPEGIAKADVILVGLEDGDRCEALVATGRKVIVIDLNPLSRSAQRAHVAIVDELTRAFPALDEKLTQDASLSRERLQTRIDGYDSSENLQRAIHAIRKAVG